MLRRLPRIELRIQVLGFFILLAVGALVVRLWWVQVARGETYTKRIAGRSQVTVRIPSVRGEIRDRNGLPLVQNRASYEVDFYLRDMVTGYRQKNGAVPKLTYRGTNKGMAKEIQEADIVRIVNDAVIPRLEELDLAKDYNSKKLMMHYRNDTEIPFTYIEDIDFPTIAKFSEHDVGLPGVDISIKPVREYLYGALAAHLLGYVGAPNDIDQEEAAKYNFYQPDLEGKSQIELYMDKYLCGTPGKRILQRSVKGVIEGEVKRESPKPGDNVYLTIDARLQMITEEALRAVGRAAAVVVDPNNGNILAMASVPSYDPNTFIPSISSKDWADLRNDEADPLVNRAISAFPPGSTFKAVTSLAGLSKGLANNHFTCTGSVTYGNHEFHCWIAEKHGSHGSLGLTDAIKVSCDCFFYQYGNAAGIDAIDTVGQKLGLGEKSGIELTDEATGVLPGPEWMRTHSPNEKWTSAYTANVSIGQGYDLCSPLQMAMVYSAVANGGISYYPRLIDKLLTPEGQTVLDDEGKVVVPQEPKIRDDLRQSFSGVQIELVRKGLWKVVNEDGGTGNKARIPGIQVAGKTGTAQAWRGNKKDDIAWFCCFAPYDHPRYVIAVMVQGGEHGGSVATPIACRILEEAIALEQGKYTQNLAKLAPAHKANPFQTVAAVDYKNAAPGAVPDPETPDQSPEKPEMQKTDSAAPDIRADADASGKVRKGARPADQQQAQQPDRRSIFEKFFHPKPQPQKNQNQTAPTPAPGRSHLF